MISLSKPSWLRKILRVMLLLFFWLVIPLLLIEIGMIVLEPYLFKGFFQYDPDLGFRVRPYTGETNQYGFNDKDYPLRREPGTFRILVLGDSFGWSGNRDGNYTALLEDRLNGAPNKTKVEVINASVPMTHTGEQLSMLKKYGLQFEPDLVVLGFFTGNDFIDADPNRKRIVVNDTYVDIDKRHAISLFGYPIIRRTRLLLFLQQKYTVFREQLRNRPADPAAAVGTFSEETFLSIEKSRMEFCNLKTPQRYAPNIEFIFQSLREMRDILKARGIPLLVAIFPDEFQVEDQLSSAVINKFNLDRNDYDLELMQKDLRAFLESENIPYVDMLERFREAGKRESLYLLRDTHWNSAGNHLAAAILEERLTPVMQVRLKTGATIIP